MNEMSASWASASGAGVGGVTFRVKSFFFDRALVLQAVDKASRVNLARVGALIRMIARRSMRYVTEPKAGSGRERRMSQPGEPPRAVQPHPWIRQNLFYAFVPGNNSVIVGPVDFFPRSGAPRILEFGGRASWRNKRRRIRRIGGSGEIRWGTPITRTTKTVIDRLNNTVYVTYAKLKTQAQVDRANRFNEFLYGPLEKTVYVASRPFMGPALSQAMPDVPKLWANSVHAA